MFNTIALGDLPPSAAHRRLFDEVVDEGKLIEDDFALLGLLRGKPTFVVDVGANIGAFSAAALRLIETVDVVAFEANPSLGWFLHEVRKRFEVEGRSMRVELFGLADSEGAITLHIPRVDDWHVIGEASMDPSVFHREVVRERLSGYSRHGEFSVDRAEVAIRVFDRLGIAPPHGVDQVFVKIDVENYEPYVLLGMREFLDRYKPIIMMENSRQDARDFVASLGFVTHSYDVGSRRILPFDGGAHTNLIYIHPAAGWTVSLAGQVAPEVAPRAIGVLAARRTCVVRDASARVPLTLGGAPQCFGHKGMFHQAYRCAGCGHIFFDAPPQADLDDYYQSVYPDNARSWYNHANDIAPGKTTTRADMVKSVLDANGFGREAVLHEFGAAFGGTVAELARRGYTISGSELNKGAVAEAREKGNTLLFDRPAADVVRDQHGKANVIYSFHCLEHFSDPYSFLESLKEVLADDGCVILFVPNGFALDPMTMGYTSYSWFSYPGHLNLWSAASLSCAAERTGYDLVQIGSNEVRVRANPSPFSVAGAAGGGAGKAFAQDLVTTRHLGEELFAAMVPKGGASAKRLADKIAACAKAMADQRTFEVTTWAAAK